VQINLHQVETTETSRRANGTTIRTLIVDDSIVMRNALSRLSEVLPFVEVIGTAADGLEALEKVAAHRPELVVMDLQMPGMNGADAATLLKEQYPHIQVILMSLHAPEAFWNEGGTIPADAFVSKHNLAVDLPETIRRLFHKSS
jgi:DNA-binding NarL/FixJ family response regulator